MSLAADNGSIQLLQSDLSPNLCLSSVSNNFIATESDVQQL